MFPANASRKLTGLYIGLGALLVLAIVGSAAATLFGVAESFFAQIGGMMTTITGAHQTAQAMADRSPNYPNVAAPGAPAMVAQPAMAVQPARDPGNLLTRLWRPQVAAYGALTAVGLGFIAWPFLGRVV